MYNECVIVMIWFTILWFWFEKWDVVETFSRCVQCYTSRTQPACWEKRRNRVNEFNNIVLPMVLWVNDDGYQLIRFTPLTQFYKWPNNHLATGTDHQWVDYNDPTPSLEMMVNAREPIDIQEVIAWCFVAMLRRCWFRPQSNPYGTMDPAVPFQEVLGVWFRRLSTKYFLGQCLDL